MWYFPANRSTVRPPVLAVLVLLAASNASWAAGGELEIRAVDADTKEPVAVRMHLWDAQGRARKIPRVPNWADHFAFSGKIVLELGTGRYTFRIERGPEYRPRIGHFLIQRGATDNKQVEMQRFVDMKGEGWWSGDLHVHRRLEDMKLLMLAEDLHVAPVITWWRDKNPWKDNRPPDPLLVRFDTNRFYRVMAGEDEREGGALLYFNLPEPLPLAGATREYPSPMRFLKQARQVDGAHVDVEKPFWWDTPVWIASGMADSIGLANNHQFHDGVLDNEAWGKPRDRVLFPSPHGNGRWSQEIYYRLIESGVRIPPSAGSASGVLPNPVGYNRVYVHCGGELTYENWWEGLRRGRVVVTNGPMLRPLVNGRLPGHVFRGNRDEGVTLEVALELSTRDKIEYLEIVKNGLVVQEVRLSDWAAAGGKLPPVAFSESGWLLVRAVTNNNQTYRFASTGPYYVEIDGRPRISKAAAQFFLDWIHERVRRVEIDNAEHRAEVVKYHRAARDFWQKRVDQATAD